MTHDHDQENGQAPEAGGMEGLPIDELIGGLDVDLGNFDDLFGDAGSHDASAAMVDGGAVN